ncbi:MAG: HDOD domain-containing protein [bacterium]|nr:HDOD domain-containing protein [bacterium]
MTVTEEIIQKIDYFHSPETEHKLLEVIDTPGTSIDDIMALLEYDIPITANILKLCNSPAYTINGGIGSLREAVERIGLVELKKFITLTASNQMFSKGTGQGYEVGMGEMRRHSAAAAIISRHLLDYEPQIKDQLFTTCLLHDTGKLVLSEYISEHYEKIVSLINHHDYDFTEAEKEVIGMTHAEVGARILEKWQFPDEIVEAVRFHHNPEAVPDSPLTHFVSLADRIAMLLGFTTVVDGLGYRGFPKLYKKYKMKESHLEVIAMDAIDEIKRVIPFERRGRDADEELWTEHERKQRKKEL